MKTVNMTFIIEDSEVVNFEDWFRHNFDVKDFKLLPETSDLYENDKHYKALSDAVRKAKREKDIYLNEIKYGIK